jgi:hypothetical protein
LAGIRDGFEVDPTAGVDNRIEQSNVTLERGSYCALVLLSARDAPLDAGE